jgi:epsin
MSEIADMTHNPMQFTEIMSMVWKRLNDHGKNWRHVNIILIAHCSNVIYLHTFLQVYKSLVLLDYLIKCGSERVAQQCKENIFSIETLKVRKERGIRERIEQWLIKDFQHIEDNRDQGLNVRTKAKQMVTLLADEEKLKNERARFMLTRKRFMQNGSSGISSDGRRPGRSQQRAIEAAGFIEKS